MEINRNNYETFFLLYLDRELDPSRMQDVERFLGENADLQREFSLLQKTVFIPSEMIFSEKESLYRHEEKRRIIPLYWMRIAAAAAVLIIGSWIIIANPLKINKIKTEPAQHILKSQQIPETEIVKKENLNSQSATEVNKNQSDVSIKSNQPPMISDKNSGAADQKLKAKNNQQQPSLKIDKENSSMNGGSDEPMVAVKKSGTPELQTTQNVTANPKETLVLSGSEAPVLLLASEKTMEPVKYEEAVLKDNEYPSDNAISVVSLNNNNGISGFLKKITKRTPADEKTRKLRVSVFQISY